MVRRIESPSNWDIAGVKRDLVFSLCWFIKVGWWYERSRRLGELVGCVSVDLRMGRDET